MFFMLKHGGQILLGIQKKNLNKKRGKFLLKRNLANLKAELHAGDFHKLNGELRN